MFGLPPEPQFELHDPTLIAGIGAFGFPENWLQSVLATTSPEEKERTFLFQVGDITTTVRMNSVVNAAQNPLGQLLVFEQEKGRRVAQEKRRQWQSAHDRLQQLSKRELEILDMVYDGMTSKAIALETRISEKTVEKHRSRIMQKLGVPNAIRLVRCVSETRLAAGMYGSED